MTWHSQAGQDEWVHSIVGDTGYFVDVGAHDGLVHSNTYALEQLGWTGVCFEPNRAAYKELCVNRTTAYSHPFAVSDHHGTVTFNGVRLITGMQAQIFEAVPVAPLTSLLDDVDAPPVVDYLSIDVEGHELEVLAGMDFDRWHVRLITIEHNLYCDGPDRKNAIFDVLTGHGFELIEEDVIAEGYGEYEDWYANRQHLTAVQEIRMGRNW